MIGIPGHTYSIVEYGLGDMLGKAFRITIMGVVLRLRKGNDCVETMVEEILSEIRQRKASVGIYILEETETLWL